MVKNTNKSDDKKSDKKLNVTNILSDVISNVDLNDVKNLSIYHNSRDLFDDKFYNRRFNCKLNLTVKKLTVSDDLKSVMLSNDDYLNLSNLFKTSNDVLILTDKKSKIIYSKMIINNQLVNYDVDLHNTNVISKKSVSKKLTLNQIDDIISKIDLNDVKSNDDLKSLIKDLI